MDCSLTFSRRAASAIVISPARTLNTILVFFSTAITGGLAMPDLLQDLHNGPATKSDARHNKPFGRWGEVFGDDTVAAAMIDRLVHHAEVLALSGDSYRTRSRREREPSGCDASNRSDGPAARTGPRRVG